MEIKVIIYIYWAGLHVLSALHMYAAMSACLYAVCSSERWMFFPDLWREHAALYTIQYWADLQLKWTKGKRYTPLYKKDTKWNQNSPMETTQPSMYHIFMPTKIKIIFCKIFNILTQIDGTVGICLSALWLTETSSWRTFSSPLTEWSHDKADHSVNGFFVR